MKTIFLMALVFITTSCTLFNQEEKFVNPLFYKKMCPGSAKNFWDVQITPTTYYTENELNGNNETRQCEMLKNTQDEIILKCKRLFSEKEKEWFKKNRPGEFDDKDGSYWTYVFRIYPLPEDHYSGDMFYIRKISYYEDETEPCEYTGYAIDTPRK